MTATAQSSIVHEVAAGRGIRLTTAARLFPSCRRGRPCNPATVWRWITCGVRAYSGDRVRLEAAKTPSGWVTSESAIQRFLEQLTPPAGDNDSPIPAPKVQPQRRESFHRRAAAELERVGI